MFRIQTIQETLEKLDQIKRPYIVYYHPDDKKIVEQIKDIAILEETPFIDPGKIIVADRSSIENYYKNWFDEFEAQPSKCGYGLFRSKWTCFSDMTKTKFYVFINGNGGIR